ncbi:MAG: hypothetical protein LAO78_25755, partial [Acidobacteriia bacterium]|nr:hypothetical protein [Terriglobia bacterium]
GCSPAEPASASSASLILQPTTSFVEPISANGNRGVSTLSQLRGSLQYHADSGSSHGTRLGISRWLRNGWRLLRAVLREIFDESAYDRFLLRTQRQRSAESYRSFMVERDAAAATKPRCC